MNFTDLDKAIMIGLIIGDGYLDNKGRLQVAHCTKQKEYCIYKAKLLHSVTGGKDIKVDRFSKTWIYQKNGVTIKTTNDEYYRFRRQSNSFLYFRELMYPNNKKIITREILDLMTPLSIALWWLDDGCLTEKYTYKNGNKIKCGYTLRLFTYMSKEENEIIQKYFLDKYDMKWNVVPADNAKDESQWMIRCGVNEGRKFLNIIRDVVLKNVPTMSYKVLNI